MPNARNAEIDLRKFEEYSMNPENLRNQGKWIAFVAIGYDVEDAIARRAAAQDVISQVREQIPVLPATQGQISFYGNRFEVQVLIQGSNDLTGTLITIWQIDHGKEIPRLITNWLEVHQ